MPGVGAKVKMMRLDKGFGLRELARKAGIPPATLQRVERDGPRGPNPTILKKLADAFGVQTDNFFDDSVFK